MPEWMFAGIVGLVASALMAAGGVLGHLLAARTQRTTAATQAAATMVIAEKTDAQALIDQLQEERQFYIQAAETRAAEQDERLERIEKECGIIRGERDLLKDHAIELREHIYAGKPPPPPEWPAALKPRQENTP
jgi:hypothetical protein